MLKEFKQFALRGNIVDLAVAVMIGTAFNAIVSSLVSDIFMPVIGMITGNIDFTSLSYTVGDASIAYGNFIQSIFTFLLTAIALFLVVKVAISFRKKDEKPQEPPAPPADIVLLTEIRDLLKK